jgi:hypothetical protein
MKRSIGLAILLLAALARPASLARDAREVWDELYPPAMGPYRYMVIREECLAAQRVEPTYIDCVDARVRGRSDRAWDKAWTTHVRMSLPSDPRPLPDPLPR